MVQSAIMTSLGIGWGLLVFLISLSLSIIAFVLVWLLHGTKKRIFFCCIAVLLPLVVFLFFFLAPKAPLSTPGDNQNDMSSEKEKVDKNFFFRLFLVIALFIAVLLCFIIFIKHVIFVPTYAKPLVPFKTKED